MAPSQYFFFFAIMASFAGAAPLARSNSSGFSQQQNGVDAQQLNAQFATLSSSDPCTSGNQACVNGAFAQCVTNSWQLTPCSSGLSCFALPLVNKAGTSLACDTQSDAEARFVAAGVQGGVAGNSSTSANTTNVPSASTSFASSSPTASQTLSMNTMKKRQLASSYPSTFGFATPGVTTSSSFIGTGYASTPTSNVTTTGLANPSVVLNPMTAFSSGVSTASPSLVSPSPNVTTGTTSGLFNSSAPLVTPAPSSSLSPAAQTTTTGTDGVATVVVVSTMFVTVTADAAVAPACSVSSTPTNAGFSGIGTSVPAVMGTTSPAGSASPSPSYAPATTINLNNPAVASVGSTSSSAATVGLTTSSALPSATLNTQVNAASSSPVVSATSSSPFNFV